MQRVTLIDNYDSFTFNLVHYLGELGAEVSVWRNDEITVADALAVEAGRDRAVARAVHAERSGRVPRPRPRGQRNDADARRLSRPSGDRPGVRRRHRARAGADARQGLAHFASCARALSRPERTLSARRAITRSSSSDRARPPNSRSARKATTGSSWALSIATARCSGCSSIRRASPASTGGKSCAISWTWRTPFISASRLPEGNAKRGSWNRSSL